MKSHPLINSTVTVVLDYLQTVELLRFDNPQYTAKTQSGEIITIHKKNII